MNNTVRYVQDALSIFKTRNLLENQYAGEFSDYLLSESTLSKLIGSVPGGQNIVRWMHARHLLSNTAEYKSHPFSERIMWSEFKSHPDQFMIISASNGVAGIKPNEAYIRSRQAEKAAKGQEYNPALDNRLTYQIIAFRRDEQVDPALLRNPADVDRDSDPTVMKARGGLVGKTDTRNTFNIFDSLARQIGSLQAVYISTSRSTGIKKADVKKYVRGFAPGSTAASTTGGIERDKMALRRPQVQPVDVNSEMARFKDKLQPVAASLFDRIGRLAMLDIKEKKNDAKAAGNRADLQRWTEVGKHITDLLTSIKKSKGVDITAGPVAQLINRSIKAAAAEQGSELADYVAQLNATPGAEKLKPFMAALKANMINI